MNWSTFFACTACYWVGFWYRGARDRYWARRIRDNYRSLG